MKDLRPLVNRAMITFDLMIATTGGAVVLAITFASLTSNFIGDWIILLVFLISLTGACFFGYDGVRRQRTIKKG